MIPGHKGYVKTSVFFTTYDEVLANDIRKAVELNARLITFLKSNVIKELYFMEIEGNAKEFIEDLLRERVLWYKIDVIEFK